MKIITLGDFGTNLVVAWNSLETDVIRKCWTEIMKDEKEDHECNIPLSEQRKVSF